MSHFQSELFVYPKFIISINKIGPDALQSLDRPLSRKRHCNPELVWRTQVKILGEEVERVTHFKYLGTSIEEEGGMETDIAKRMGAGWMNWKKCS